jgi:hypothetical protein
MKAMQAIGIGLVLALAHPASAQDPLGSAKDLYAAASYEEALSTLSRLADGAAPDVARQIDQYRAFSLVALGRHAEAERVAERLVRNNPLGKFAEGEVSPRIEKMFAAVRTRVLPGLIRDEYRTARTAIERKDYKAAEPHLRLVSRMLEEMQSNGTIDETLSDLRLIVDGFLDLSRTSAQQATRERESTVAAAALVETAPVAARPSARPSAALVSAPAARPPIYAGNGDTHLLPPVAVSQASPELPRNVSEIMRRTTRKTLVMELLIDERGDVEQAVVVEPVEPVYDLLVLRAARQWKYRPATVDGVPVKFRKSIGVDFLDQ